MSRIEFACRFKRPSGFALDARFDADAGVTALFGPSGSGKSTVCGLLTGVLRPQAGSIRLGERVLLDSARGTFIPPESRRIGCVFQEGRLFPHLSVEANLRYGLRRRHSRAISFDRVVDVLEVRDLLPRSTRGLSGGEAQRVALGRAILSGPELLILDEALAALHEALKGKVLGYLERVIAEWRIPTVFVTHDAEDVRRLAERVIVMEAGRVVAAGDPARALGPAAGP